ncbi:F-box protein [Phanerochaete sordida]|uniref:F-box protein n=1 Tax=Phanerochaete sordida TaxID=48140 RepID=A0A9P3GPB8_9APHY|nr:F-box protein [Phanerochaete sordida]
MSLPPEILTQIFAEAARDAHETYVRSLKHESLPRDPELPRPYSWITLTHVCRLWRVIALSRPALWSDISVIDADATEEIMERTRSHTITITFRLPAKSVTNGDLPWAQADKRMDLYSWLLETELHRTTAITGPAMLGDFSPFVVAQATRLRALAITAPNIGPIATAPGAFAFPALEHLEYRAAGRHSPAPLLGATLRTLLVQPAWQDAVDPAATYVLDARELVRALRGMPRLEALDVRISDTHGASPAPEHDAVPAPHLRTVRLVGAAPACAHVLQHVALPPDARLDIECVARDVTPDMAPRPVPHAIAAVLRGPPCALYAPCAAFAIEGTDGGYVLRGWRRADERYAERAADVVLRCGAREAGAVLAVLLRVFALHAVEHVRIAYGQLDLFGACAGFEELARGVRLRSMVLDGVEVALVSCLLLSTTAADVTLENIKFKPSDPRDAKQWEEERAAGPDAVVLESQKSMRALAQLLAGSSTVRSLRTLRLRRVTNVRAQDVDALREHIAVLEWDGVESIDLSYDRSTTTVVNSLAP